MSTLRIWCPDDTDEERAVEQVDPGGPLEGYSAAEQHAEHQYWQCDYPETQRIHVRRANGEIEIFDVKSEQSVAFRAVKVKP